MKDCDTSGKNKGDEMSVAHFHSLEPWSLAASRVDFAASLYGVFSEWSRPGGAEVGGPRAHKEPRLAEMHVRGGVWNCPAAVHGGDWI